MATLSDSAVLAAFDRIRVWQRSAHRAPHKPLLVLLVLGRIWRGFPASVEFSDIDADLRQLLVRFGPASAASSHHYPFWHLKTDGIWVLGAPSAMLQRPARATPTLTELRNERVTGAFTPEIVDALQRNRVLIPTLAARIAQAHFPASLQRDVLEAVGFDVDEFALSSATATSQRQRDPAFRAKVMLAYEARCCLCGHDLRIGGQVVGLEAAHIQWFQANGPDIEPNGLALCSLHHKLFDLGIFTVVPETYLVLVTQHVTGSEASRDRLLAYHGAGLILPQSRAYYPDPKFLDWHKKEVFKEPARDIG